MPATATSITPRRSSGNRVPDAPRRRPLRDNPRLILAGIAALSLALVVILVLANGTRSFSPDFLTEFVLYALSAADLTILVALAFVLARNIVKLIVERRRALPFARFRAKLVALLLAMTLVPAVLVLMVGSELIRTNIDRWFNAPMEDMLAAANQIAGDYYRERLAVVADHAGRIAGSLAAEGAPAFDAAPVGELIAPEVDLHRVQAVRVYRARAAGTTGRLALVAESVQPGVPAGRGGAAAEEVAVEALAGSADARRIERLGAAGDLLHAAAVVREPDGEAIGVVVASGYLAGEQATRPRRLAQAFESYNQLRVLRRPLTGLYLSFFLMVTLMILVGATWMGLYVAKRITRPVLALAAAAREIGAGRLDQHVEPQGNDEFGTLVDAFNTMASELAISRRRVERSTLELERKHVEVEARRRYIETILERVATGVVSIDAAGAIATINAAASRLLGLEPAAIGRPAAAVFDTPDLQPIRALLAGAGRSKDAPSAQEVAISRAGQELRLAAVATPLVGETSAPEGVVLVLDDVTPLIRAQKVATWREVARRLAHEIKNPLTPIQLSAERLRRHFSAAPPNAKALVEECTTTIVAEVESLKGLVDEFSQFARMPAPRTVPTDLSRLIGETLALYDGLFPEVRIERRFAAGVPRVRLDAEQIRRVIINLVDNAIEAMEQRGTIVIETQLDAGNSLARVVVADDGPGIPAAEREKLFLPYYSTKRRGSGLGLAIVRRIIAEHGGSIDVGDNAPHGTRFTIELPC
ncbi:MAG: HAMP domain-containing protein [Acidobacteria bacterium]|nr:HAMP domain-containing protein [Acidobacteriota bacterium]